MARNTVRKKTAPGTVDSIEKLAIMMADGFSEMEERMEVGFDAVDARFDALEKRVSNIESDIHVIKITLERMDTRIAALEMAVFGASHSGGRVTDASILARVEELEKKVFGSV